MEFNEIVEFAERTISDAGGGGYKRSDDMEKRIMASAMKLTEEAGELMEQVLGALSLQRKSKEGQYTPETLADEFADMVLVAIRLAKMMNVDIESALDAKMKKIRARSEQKTIGQN